MTKKLNWLTAAALTLGGTAMVAAPAFADHDYWRDRRPEYRDRYDRFDRDIDREISLSDVPHRVRETMDRELGRMQRRIEHVWFVRRDGKEFYRVQVDRRGNDDLSFRISPDGRLLSVQDVPDRNWHRY